MPPVRQTVRRGFSLTELLIVVVMIGVLVALAIPRVTLIRGTFTLDQAAQQIQSDLRLAQSQAIRENQTIDFTRVTDSTYTIESIGTRRLPWPVKFATGTSSLVKLTSYGPPIGGSGTFIVTQNSQKRTVSVNAVGRVTASNQQAL